MKSVPYFKQLSILVVIIFLALISYHWRRSVIVIYGYSPFTCRLHDHCGNLIGIDCNSAADGPYNYVSLWTGRTLSYCGGACMSGCQNCPPAEWTCGR